MIRSSFRATAVALAVLAIAVLIAPRAAYASASPGAIAVLDREAQMLAAFSRGDAKTLGAILAENYVHVTYQGKLEYREDVLKDLAFYKALGQKTSEQTVDFAGDAAVVHGLNTITRGGKVVMLIRYTDVYAKQAGSWREVSAQETPVAK